MIQRHDATGGFGTAVRKAAFAALVALSLSPALPARAVEWNGSCEIAFRGVSTLHDFEGTVRCQPFRLAAADPAGGKAVIPGAVVAAAVSDMDTGNASRDRQMRGMFESDRFPRIRVTFKDIDPETIRKEARSSSDGTFPLEFALEIRDVSRPIRAVARNFRDAGGTVSFDVEYPVSLREYRLVPPTALFGIVRVDDTVVVKTAVRLEPAGPK